MVIRMTPTTELLVDITRCTIAARCLANEPLGCWDLVGSQDNAAPFQVPEPWSGRIGSAPILFVSSNPSVDHAEMYPNADWDDRRRIDFFEQRFDHRPEPWVDPRLRPRLATSPASYRPRATPFWTATRARASELLGFAAVPGIDFALTEVVHCKSRDEIGVDEALQTCVETWLSKVLAVASAEVVVLFGAHARDAFHCVYATPRRLGYLGPHNIEGRQRLVLQLPHPNARTRRVNCYPLSDTDLLAVRTHLARPRSNEDALADPERFGVDPVPVHELVETYRRSGLPVPPHLRQ